MANSLLTIDMITKAALKVLHNKLTVIKNCNRQYDASFGVTGAKIGDTLRVRRPVKYSVRSGATVAINDVTESKDTLTIANQKGVDLSLTSFELSLQLDDMIERVLNPAMARLATTIESDLLASVVTYAHNAIGTGGTALTSSTALSSFIGAKSMLDKYIAPIDGRFCVVNPDTEAVLRQNNLSIFNPSDAISNSYTEGVFGRFSGMDFATSNLIPNYVTGSRTNGTVSTTVADATAWAKTGTIVVTGVGATNTVKAGEVFTVAGVYAVNDETKQPLSNLQQFTVVSDATAAAGVVTLTVSPAPLYNSKTADSDAAIKAAAIAFNARFSNISKLPTATDVVTFNGTASSTTPMSLAWQKDAIAFVSADIVMPNGSVETASATKQFDGISMRYVQQYVITTDQYIGRFDVLYGYTTLYPQHVVKIIG